MLQWENDKSTVFEKVVNITYMMLFLFFVTAGTQLVSKENDGRKIA